MPKRRKIVKIEPVVWNKRDFLTVANKGYTEHRILNNGGKVDLDDKPLEERLRSYAKASNHCATCNNFAVKIVYLAVKGGGSQLERYCPECFDRVVDLDKMILKPLDDSEILAKLTITESRNSGKIPRKDNWDLGLKKWQRV